MELSRLDIGTFVAFIAFVIGVSVYASRREESTEDYFLAGRKLTWWLIGFSLIASNISVEHFVGMSGKGYEIGLAIASYEWMAAVTLVLVGWFLLPKFLRCGIYTMPEFLEYRYSPGTRSLMAVFLLIAYVIVALASWLFLGALALEKIFGFHHLTGIWLIGIVAGAYTIYGGLKAVVWTDLIQALALLLGGAVISVIGLSEMGGVARFFEASSDKLHMVLPWNDPDVPWLAVFVGGLWIPNIFYWGLNQFITQRTLGAKNLKQAQRGVLFGGVLKLFIPFIVVFPGIMAAHLFGDRIQQNDAAYPTMVREILPAGLRGVMLAALCGAVMSSIDSLLNSASTIFTMDLYKRYLKRDASSRSLVVIGRIFTGIFVIMGCLWAPHLKMFKEASIFDYLQRTWGFITPGIVTAFLFGIFVKRTPPLAAKGAMILGIPVYALCFLLLPETAFLHHMAITFLVLSAFVLVVTLKRPLPEPVKLPVYNIQLDRDRLYWVWGSMLIGLTAALYVIFW